MKWLERNSTFGKFNNFFFCLLTDFNFKFSKLDNFFVYWPIFKIQSSAGPGRLKLLPHTTWGRFCSCPKATFSPKSPPSLCFLYHLSNQAKHVKMACLAWFDRRFKNHWLLPRVVGTHFNQKNKTRDNYGQIWTPLRDWSQKVQIFNSSRKG